jgi:hypothetical protein
VRGFHCTGVVEVGDWLCPPSWGADLFTEASHCVAKSVFNRILAHIQKAGYLSNGVALRALVE